MWKTTRWIAGGVMMFFLTFLNTAAAVDDPEARAVMQRIDALESGDNRSSEMEMILVDRNNRERVRRIKAFSKKKGDDTYGIMFFLHPADVRGTGFLTYDYDDPDKDNDQWLYLPALRKTRRIASSDRSGSFMGSDFSYADMSSMNIDDYDFHFNKEQKEIVIDGHKCWVIEAIPGKQKTIDETGYTRSMLFVRQDIPYIIRARMWLDKGGYEKFLTVLELQQIEGVWVGIKIQMVKRRGGEVVHKTLLNFHDVKFNQDLDFDLFTIRRLEAGL